MSDLGSRFKAEYPDLHSLEIDPVETGIIIGGKDEASNIYVLQDEEGWVVSTLQAHEHVKSADEGLVVAADLARGRVRVCQEYRGEALAASWLEYPDGDEFETGGVAVFLSPFDRDEWRLWEGETWRLVHTTRSLDTNRLSTSAIELTVDESIHCRSTMLDRLKNGLGEPATGMKWRVDFRGMLVLQIPSGWRSVRTHEGAEDFEPEHGGLIMRTSVFFRNAETPHRELLQSAARPTSIESAVLEGHEEWTQERWTLMFGDGDQDIMAWVELYANRVELTIPSLVREQVTSTINKALYIPPDWDSETIV